MGMDMSLIPMPNVEVVSSRDQTVEVRAPEEKIVTEAAFKRRTVPPLVLIVRPAPRVERDADGSDSLHSCVCVPVQRGRAASRPTDSGQLGRRWASVLLSSRRCIAAFCLIANEGVSGVPARDELQAGRRLALGELARG